MTRVNIKRMPNKKRTNAADQTLPTDDSIFGGPTPRPIFKFWRRKAWYTHGLFCARLDELDSSDRLYLENLARRLGLGKLRERESDLLNSAFQGLE